jgi:peroxiredoxin
LAADTPARLAAFRDQHDLPYTMLSDPDLTSAEMLDIPVSSLANFAATLALHPVLLTYPKRAYLQPAVFVWLRDGTLAYEWRQTSKLSNLFGAKGRPTGGQIVDIVREVLARS